MALRTGDADGADLARRIAFTVELVRGALKVAPDECVSAADLAASDWGEAVVHRWTQVAPSVAGFQSPLGSSSLSWYPRRQDQDSLERAIEILGPMAVLQAEADVADRSGDALLGTKTYTHNCYGMDRAGGRSYGDLIFEEWVPGYRREYLDFADTSSRAALGRSTDSPLPEIRECARAIAQSVRDYAKATENVALQSHLDITVSGNIDRAQGVRELEGALTALVFSSRVAGPTGAAVHLAKCFRMSEGSTVMPATPSPERAGHPPAAAGSTWTRSTRKGC